MSDAERFLEDARKSFRLASDATILKSIEHYAEMGRQNLRLAHEAAKLVMPPAKQTPSWWGLVSTTK